MGVPQNCCFIVEIRLIYINIGWFFRVPLNFRTPSYVKLLRAKGQQTLRNSHNICRISGVIVGLAGPISWAASGARAGDVIIEMRSISISNLELVMKIYEKSMEKSMNNLWTTMFF